MQSSSSRQIFLGDNFSEILKNERIAIVGLGGGGSIVLTNLSHIGFKKFFLVDPDCFEDTNLTRLMGGTFLDIENKTPKVEIAKRTVMNISPDADVIIVQAKWQECINEKIFLESKFLMTCLDDFSNRAQIEMFARKNGMTIIDIGMNIKSDNSGRHFSMGQVVMSSPDGPCFKCLDFINDTDLENEAKGYGIKGVRPQVIWANSILASVAVGVLIEQLTNWTGTKTDSFYKHFDGNGLDLFNNFKLSSGFFIGRKCPHFCSSHGSYDLI